MTPRTPPFPSPLAVHWQHDPSVCFLNHGSFGGCPTTVLHAQQRLRNRMECETIRFFVEDLWGILDRARAALASFVNCRAEDVAPVANATVGVTTVLHHLAQTGYLKPGDEVIALDHEYPACLNNLRHVCGLVGARVRMVELPFPIAGPGEVVDRVVSAARASARPRAALISHVTSSSGLVFPIAEIVRELESLGVRTIVDGAHGVGFVRGLDLTAINASYYTSNAHKWLCTPKGSAFLWVRADRQANFRPMVLSNFAEKPRPGRSNFLTEFDFVGTNDVTAFAVIPDAIDFMGKLLPGGWGGVFDHNHGLTRRARGVLCERLGITPPAPDSMIAGLCTLPLPVHPPERQARLMARASVHHDALQDALMERWRVQVPVWSVAGRARVFRISPQVYNSIGQYEYLADALASELERERSF